MPFSPRTLIVALLLPLLSGCLAQSKIQTTYMRQQDSCRHEAQNATNATSDQVAGTAPTNSPADDPTSGVARAFSSCMNKAGWHVAVPKTQNGGQTAQNPPTGIFPSTPPAVAAARVPTPATTGAAAASPQLGPGVYPSAPAANTSAPSMNTTPTYGSPADTPAVYQPARPYDSAPAPSYGTGGGRNF